MKTIRFHFGWPRPTARPHARPRRDERGTVLIVVLGVLTILSVMGSSFALLMKTERNASTQYALGIRANMLAEDGITAAANRLQKYLATNYHSALDPDVNFGAIEVGGKVSYTDPTTHEQTYFGTGEITDTRVPVNFPYPLQFNGDAFIDVDGNGVWTDGIDVRLVEPDVANPIFFDKINDRALFSDFTHEGIYRGNSGQVAGTFTQGGDRFRLKIIETNSQLSINFIDESLYNWMVDNNGQALEGSQFKYMLHFLGSGIARIHNLAENPFDRITVDELYDLRRQFGGSFTSKDQVRDVIERNHPGQRMWQYVQDYITVHAWPGHEALNAQNNANTYSPSYNLSSYREKIGVADGNTPANAILGNPGKLQIKPTVLPPVDANTAPVAVLYSCLANLAGDSRYYYYSTKKMKAHGTDPENAAQVNDVDDGFIEHDELRRARKYPDFNEKIFATKNDETTFYFEQFDKLNSIEYQVRRMTWDLQSQGQLFDRNLQMLHHIRIDPFRADFTSAQTPGSYGGGAGGNVDYAWNLARAIEDMRPFTSWADFEKRVIDDLILGKSGNAPGVYLHPLFGQIKCCEPFENFQHPWNPVAVNGNPEMNEIKTQFEKWYYESVADLLKAALNPSPKLAKYNPDATYYQKIDRSDLVFWTVPFTFQSPGVYEITAVGEILGNVFNAATGTYGLRPVVQKQIRAVVKVAEIVRHHTQKDFLVGFPAKSGGFKDPNPLPAQGQPLDDTLTNPDEFYSVVRLTADPLNPARSRTVTYPRPANENIDYLRVPGHRVRRQSYPASGDREEQIYYTGFRTAGVTDRLYGPVSISHDSSEDFPGYITVRPQDTSPFDYEMRMEDTSGNATVFKYLGFGNGYTYSQQYPAGGAKGLVVPTNPAVAGDYLLFWMPFNETINTAGSIDNNGTYRFGHKARQHQSASIASTQGPSPVSLESTDYTNMSNGLVWAPDGFIFRAYDIKGGQFPHYLEYPSGAGYDPAFKPGEEQHYRPGDDSISAPTVIENMPSADIAALTEDANSQDEATDEFRINQDQFQLQTNFPYYHGTVEFWFKSDVDQWDMAAGGFRPSNANYIYQSDKDHFMGGFLCATNLLVKEAGTGLIGVQTFFYREMHNYLVVSRVMFMDALRDNGGSLDKWTEDTDNYPFLNWLFTRGDVVKNLTPPPVDPTDPVEMANWSDQNIFDTGDYGFMYSRYDAWVPLDSLYDKGLQDGFLWRPHEWYHLAVSFRSDVLTKDDKSTAIDFYLNGVWIDNDDVLAAMGGQNWPAWYDNTPDSQNDGLFVNQQFPRNAGVYLKRKWSTIINEIDPKARFVVGAITRRQATNQQIDDYNSSKNAAAPALQKEMFYFADGEFVAPANGTIDALRVTNRYLDIDRGNHPRTFQSTDLERIRMFARYNTEPTFNQEELGSYENGFANRWGVDVVIANVAWNEYRPKWDSARSMPFDGNAGNPSFDEAPRLEWEFRTFKPEEINDEYLRRVDPKFFHQGYGNFTSAGAIGTPDDATDIFGKIGPNSDIIDMGKSFNGAFILPKDGCFVYTAKFMNSSDPDYVANAVAILDEVTVTVLVPIEMLAHEQMSNAR